MCAHTSTIQSTTDTSATNATHTATFRSVQHNNADSIRRALTSLSRTPSGRRVKSSALPLRCHPSSVSRINAKRIIIICTHILYITLLVHDALHLRRGAPFRSPFVVIRVSSCGFGVCFETVWFFLRARIEAYVCVVCVVYLQCVSSTS